jgi:hypothetical protein
MLVVVVLQFVLLVNLPLFLDHYVGEIDVHVLVLLVALLVLCMELTVIFQRLILLQMLLLLWIYVIPIMILLIQMTQVIVMIWRMGLRYFLKRVILMCFSGLRSQQFLQEVILEE